MSPRFALLALALLASCSDAPTAPPAPADAALDTADAAPADAAPDAALDAAPDAPPADATTDAPADAPADASADAAPLDAADASTDALADATWDGSTEILGTLRGTCGTIRAMLTSPMPSLVRDDLTFVAGERYERASLSPGGQRMFDTANAGGSSTESEVMSTEVLHFCEGASLLRTETEIHYQPPDDSGANTITDILVEIGGMRVGVSVTRAYRPAPMTFTDADVRALLDTKLTGINRSSMRVLPKDRWVKQILHVFVISDAVADQVERAWNTLPAATRADTIVLVTVTHGGGFIYCNPDPPLGTECPPLGGG